MVACRPEVNKARTTPDPRADPDWLAGNPGKFSGAVTGAVDLGRYWTGGPDRRGAGRFPGRLGGPDGPGVTQPSSRRSLRWADPDGQPRKLHSEPLDNP